MFITRLRNRLKERPDTEHQAAIIRIVIALLVTVYLLIALNTGSLSDTNPLHVYTLIAMGIGYSFGVMTHILVRPQICIARRILSLCFDLFATTFGLYILGETGAPVFSLYLFNALGNGFRFGVPYLYLSCCLGLICFSVVFLTSEFWNSHQTISAGIMIAMLVIPMYAATLVRELHAALTRLRTLASHDTLTGLPNRQAFYDTFQETIANAKRDRTSFAVIFVDLDDFKPINDTLGHAVGDEMLKMVAKRLRDHIRHTDHVARIGGDEFVLLMPQIVKSAIPAIADQVIRAVAQPYYIDGKSVTLTTSLGIATYPEDGDSVDALVASADTAMYKSKRDGGGRYYFLQDHSAIHQSS